MRENDSFYRHLLEQCQSTDLDHRLGALEDLRKHEYLSLVEPQFLLDRLNSTSHWQEQGAILQIMCEMKQSLPIQALLAILSDAETSSTFLRMEIAHTLAVVQAEEAFDLLLQMLQNEEEDIAVREGITWDLVLWGDKVPRDLLLRLLADPELCAAALDMWRSQPPQIIPIQRILPYCMHEEKYLREAAIKALLQAEQRTPIDPILAALHDPEPEVRTAASFGCIRLLELFEGQIPLEPLLSALSDEYAPVRENILDAFGKVPLHVPVEPVAAALADPTFYVRCAALETLGLMGECVPSALYPVLQKLSGSDPVAQVRQRATRALLLLHGMHPAPLRVPMIDLTLDKLEEEEE